MKKPNWDGLPSLNQAVFLVAATDSVHYKLLKLPLIQYHFFSLAILITNASTMKKKQRAYVLYYGHNLDIFTIRLANAVNSFRGRYDCTKEFS